MDIAEENLHWLDSKYYEVVYGRNGNTKWEIERVSRASINIDWENQNCIIKGKKDQIETAKKRIKEELDTVDDYIDDSYTELDFVNQPHIGMVNGKKGANIKKLKKRFKVNLKVVDDKLFIKKGNPENIKKATDYLEQFIWFIDTTKDSNCKWFRHFFGNPENIITVQSPLDRDVSLIRTPAIDANEKPQLQNVKESLLKAFSLAKESQQGSVVEIPSVGYLVHPGMMVSRKYPGTYKSHSESFKKSLTYQKFKTSDLNIDGLKSLPLMNEYLRYDLSIYTPEPFHKIRYRIFLSNDREKKLHFIKHTEVENGFRSVQKGPGYFLKSDRKIAYVDLIDPEHGMTTRINSLTYDDNQSDSNIFNNHLEPLAPFFNGIKIRQKNETVPEDDKDKDLHIPISKLPSGFNLKFYRRVTRASYRFDGEDGEDGENIIHTSKEEVHIQEDTVVPTDQSEVIDLFLENKSINDLLKSNDWQAPQVVGKLAKLLRSSDKMLAEYLKIK